MSDQSPIGDGELDGLFAHLTETPLALAVSGGADSMALMHMVARWARRPEVAMAYREHWRKRIARNSYGPAPGHVPSTGPTCPNWLEGVRATDDLETAGVPPHVVVLTVDHGLRAESADESAFVAEEAHKIGLPVEVLRWAGAKPASGVQEAARLARRNLMVDVLRAEASAVRLLSPQCGDRTVEFPPFRSLVMAHHREDQAETVLMRLARGSGLHGLGGIRPYDVITRAAEPEHSRQFETGVWRPLLDVSKARLVATLNAYGARWIEDPSNDDQRFERVRVRRMMPQLSELGLTAEKIALSARRLRDAETALEQAMRTALDHDLKERLVIGMPADVLNPAFAELDLSRPRFATSYLCVCSLRWLISTYGGGARAAELSQLEALASLLLDADQRALSGGVTLGGCKIEFHGPRGRRLRIYREGSGEGLPVIPIAPGQSVDWDGRRFSVFSAREATPGAMVRAMGMQGWADVKRAVPALAGLGLPAAAAATLPVIVDGGGAVISRCGLDLALRALMAAAPEREIAAAWAKYAEMSGSGYEVAFGLVAETGGW